MRWRFSDPNDLTESRARQTLDAKIDAWWSEFSKTAPRLDALFKGRAKWDLPEWMAEHLGGIDPELMWEFGRGLRGGHRLVITPEHRRHLRPLTSAILSKAPALPGWEFYPYRLADPLDEALATIQGRTNIDFSRARAVAQDTDDGGVNLTFSSPDFAAIGEEAASGAAFVATEALLGEECLDKFVDIIDVSMNPADAASVGLDALPRVVGDRVAASGNRISPAPFVKRGDVEWTLWQLKPKEEPDYTHQLDLFVGKSALPEMWKRGHSNRVFSSARFSRFGETFCFVKLDGSQGIEKEGFADKSEIEDALETALRAEGLGSYIGGGTGRRYSYVDLALLDVEKSIPVIRETLRRGRVPNRSWLLFYDDTLRSEWVGIWDDTPPPP